MKILVVLAEDEFLVRMAAADALRDEGFEVMEAADADEALGFLNAHHRDVGLLFTDVHMPGKMDGLQLAHHAATHWPWISSLIASGRATPGQDELPPRGRFVSKPYEHANVICHLRAMTAA